MAKQAAAVDILADIKATSSRRGGVSNLIDRLPDGPAKRDCEKVADALESGALGGVSSSHAWRRLREAHEELRSIGEASFRNFKTKRREKRLASR